MKPMFWTLVLTLACTDKASDTAAGDPDTDRAELPSDDSGPSETDDTGNSGETDEPQTPGHLSPGEFSGVMETTYEYSGSFGEWDDSCSGPVTISVGEDLALIGEGDCQFEAWGMGFLIEGQQSGAAIEGLLISDNSLGRVETPFTGSRDETAVVLDFDTVHETDGESVRLLGTITGTVAR